MKKIYGIISLIFTLIPVIFLVFSFFPATFLAFCKIVGISFDQRNEFSGYFFVLMGIPLGVISYALGIIFAIASILKKEKNIYTKISVTILSLIFAALSTIIGLFVLRNMYL